MPIFWTHLGELDIILIKLLLHDLLQNFQSELVCLEKGHLLLVSAIFHKTYLVERVLELLLSSIRTGSNGFGIVSGECTRWVGMVSFISYVSLPDLQLRTLFVNSSNQQSHSKRSRLSSARSSHSLTIKASSSSTDSPNLRAKSHTACVQLSTPILSS